MRLNLTFGGSRKGSVDSLHRFSNKGARKYDLFMASE